MELTHTAACVLELPEEAVNSGYVGEHITVQERVEHQDMEGRCTISFRTVPAPSIHHRVHLPIWLFVSCILYGELVTVNEMPS